MTKFLQGSEAKAVRYLKHVLRNGSFYPLTTFWLVACGIVMATWMDLLSHTHAAVVLGFVALVLLLIADRRDQKEANVSFEAQLEAVRKLVFSSAEMASAVATARSDIQDTRSDNQERSMHAQDVSIAQITANTDKDTS